MRVPKLWLYFAVHSITLPIGLCISIGLGCLMIPPLAWVFTHQFHWMSFNRWMSAVLVAIPVGLMMAGMLTLNEWLQRTDAPVMKKIVVSAVVTTILMSSMYQVVLGINILLPH